MYQRRFLIGLGRVGSLHAPPCSMPQRAGRRVPAGEHPPGGGQPHRRRRLGGGQRQRSRARLQPVKRTVLATATSRVSAEPASRSVPAMVTRPSADSSTGQLAQAVAPGRLGGGGDRVGDQHRARQRLGPHHHLDHRRAAGGGRRR